MQQLPAGIQGLTTLEAMNRLEQVGPNLLDVARQRNLFQILLSTLREPMFLLLLAAAGLYLFVGDPAEGLFLLAGAGAAISLVIFQEARSERALNALRQMSQPYARVIRDGKECRVPAAEIVPGDLLLAGEGDRLPADGHLVSGDVLSVDESMLTGESAPVMKVPYGGGCPGPAPAGDPGMSEDAGSFVFSGTMIVRGQGVIEVVRTGRSSALGQIGEAMTDGVQELTPLQKVTRRMVTALGIVAIVFCAIIGLIYWLVLGQPVEGMLAGITIAISLIPEEFPLVLSVFLALGAWRLARRQVLVRHSAIIETLGSASMLCVDKTGTLTRNRMSVRKVWADGREETIGEGAEPSAFACRLLVWAQYACSRHPVDPMDKAVHRSCAQCAKPEGDEVWEVVRSWPVVQDRLVFIQLWRTPGGRYNAAAKGAPEFVFDLCRLSETQASKLTRIVEAYAREGMRVLAVAVVSDQAEFPEDPTQARFSFAGLLCFLDPVREEVPAAISEARMAGIEIAMITGDHPSTALAIARQAGIDTDDGVLTGSELDKVDEDEFPGRIRQTRVFARISPEQKLRIVKAFRQAGHVVAMTGDGVNDAPALEAAHIGLAMGRHGTDVAREAADLVLMNDSFVSIVGAVRMGRRIFDNLRRAMTYITAIHVPIAGLAILPLASGLPPLLYPMHIVLLEIIIDPTCSLVFEAEPADKRVMTRPPRRRDEALFGRRQLFIALVQGGTILAAVFGFYWALLTMSDIPQENARGAAFIALISGNIFLALTDSASSGRLLAPHRRIFWLIVLAVIAALCIVFLYPPAQSVFRVDIPGRDLVILAVVIGICSGGWTALSRLLPARYRSPRHSA